MDLANVAALLEPCETNGSVAGMVTGLSYDSKTAKPGDLFFCLRGQRADGHRFAGEAVAQGALALVVEEFLPLPAPQIRVRDSRAALSAVGRRFYGEPARRLGLVGVTGTNGKTTATFYIRTVLGKLGPPVGLIGTIYNQLVGPPEASALTTPESADLWRLFGRAVEDGCRWVVMEVSSHALAMGRVEPADFDIAVVTNITRDHFEYHGTFEHYLASKTRLVQGLDPERKGELPKAAVLNGEDPNVMGMAQGLDIPVITYGFNDTLDVYASDVKTMVAGSFFTLQIAGSSPTRVFLPMPGRFNIANALSAAAVGWLAGVDLASIVAALEECRYVPGRTEVIDEDQDFHVIVDFAHNPDALANLLSVKPAGARNRTILVFGAEGGKDQGKRPQMGAAARSAGHVIITSDNMYKEDPAEVARQIAEGLGDRSHEVILDRREAIARAVELAETGDLLIIAGKGHEQTWVYGGERRPFDDRAVVRQLLRSRLGKATV